MICSVSSFQLVEEWVAHNRCLMNTWWMSEWLDLLLLLTVLQWMSSIFSPFPPSTQPWSHPRPSWESFYNCGKMRVIEGSHLSPTLPALEGICVNPYASRKELNSWLAFSLSFPHMLHKAMKEVGLTTFTLSGGYHICRWPASAMPGKSSARSLWSFHRREYFAVT